MAHPGPAGDIHLEHARQLFLSERSRRETIRGSISTPVAAISFAVFAFSSLVLELDAGRWREASTLAIMALGSAAIAALFASAWQVVMSEWLFVYHEPPRLSDLMDGEAGAAESEARLRGLLAASYAVAYEQYLRGNAASSRHRTWALRLILLSLLLQALAFAVLPFHLAGS
jgi:hypothetical protein